MKFWKKAEGSKPFDVFDNTHVKTIDYQQQTHEVKNQDGEVVAKVVSFTVKNQDGEVVAKVVSFTDFTATGITNDVAPMFQSLGQTIMLAGKTALIESIDVKKSSTGFDEYTIKGMITNDKSMMDRLLQDSKERFEEAQRRQREEEERARLEEERIRREEELERTRVKTRIIKIGKLRHRRQKNAGQE